MTNVVVIIPAYNEELSIAKVIAEIPQPPVLNIIVADNNSSDNTVKNACAAGAIVVNENEQGYGAACLRGIAEARRMNAEIIIFIDGDYSDYPEEIPTLLQPVLSGEYDFVIGSRKLGKVEKGGLTPQQRFGNWLACLLMRWLMGVNYTDLGPFRVISMDALLKLDMQDHNYGWTVEMQLKAVKCGLRVTELPVRYRKRIGKSKVSGTVKGVVMAGYKIIVTIFRYALECDPITKNKSLRKCMPSV